MRRGKGQGVKGVTVATLFLLTIICISANAQASVSVEKIFLEGNYAKAAIEADKAIDARSGPRDEMYYIKGMSELKMGKYKEARNSLTTITRKYSYSRRTTDAYIGIGDSYFLEGNVDQAIKEYNNTLNRYPNAKETAVLYHKLGNCYKKLGSADKASHYYDMVKKTAPLSFEARMVGASDYSSKSSPGTITGGNSTNYLSIQVGSFKDKNNAERLARKLSEQGYDSFTEVITYLGDTVYRVKVGRLGSKEAAESLESRLKKEGYPTRICTKDACQ